MKTKITIKKDITIVVDSIYCDDDCPYKQNIYEEDEINVFSWCAFYGNKPLGHPWETKRRRLKQCIKEFENGN
jgi:hypothetical protein